jgi:hypothetical protein
MKKFLLAILSLGSAAFAHAQCTELFFSEYVEGSSHSKALEIYNPTSSPIALSNYEIIRFSNGSSSPVDSIPLTGTIAAHDVWVVVNGQATPDVNGAFCDPALMAMGDQVGPPQYVTGTAVMYFNGDDALVLVKIAPRTFVDIFGKIGEDPGTAWTDVFPYTDAQGAWLTINHTLIRKPTVTQGVTVNPATFNTFAEWDTLPENTWTNLGMHNSICNLSAVHEIKADFSVKAFPNPTSGIFTVSASIGIASVEVYNALGEAVYLQRFANNDQQQQLDLSSEAEGLYILQVELTNGRKITSKVSIH